MNKKINPKLLEPFPDEERELATLIYLCIAYELDVRKYTERVSDETNEIVNTMFRHNRIDMDYESEVTRWRLCMPLDKESYSDEFVDKLRQKFSAKNIGERGYLGDKYEVQVKLQEFKDKYPSYTEEQLLKATDDYIQHCISTGTYIRHAANFIEGLLSVWVEQTNEEYVKQEDNAI